MCPEPNDTDFFVNYFPFIEFKDPDTPWRFSPSPASDTTPTPWLTLICLQKSPNQGAEYDLGPPSSRTQPLPAVDVKAPLGAAKLPIPELSFAWRTAHVQITNDHADPHPLTDLDPSKVNAEIVSIEENREEDTISRLFSFRRLKPHTSYTAFLVPTFAAGVAAGLGQSTSDINHTTLAWNKSRITDVGNPLRLPYYHKWDFATGERGDFESLLMTLKPRTAATLAKYNIGELKLTINKSTDALYTVDGGENFPSPAKNDEVFFTVDSAIKNLDAPASTDQNPQFETELSKLLDATFSTIADRVAPPIYGQYAGRIRRFPAPLKKIWVTTLNKKTTHRFAAGLGSSIIRTQQELFMSIAWDQLGDLPIINDFITRGQISIFTRNLTLGKWVAANTAVELMRNGLFKNVLVSLAASEQDEDKDAIKSKTPGQGPGYNNPQAGAGGATAQPALLSKFLTTYGVAHLPGTSRMAKRVERRAVPQGNTTHQVWAALDGRPNNVLSSAIAAVRLSTPSVAASDYDVSDFLGTAKANLTEDDLDDFEDALAGGLKTTSESGAVTLNTDVAIRILNAFVWSQGRPPNDEDVERFGPGDTRPARAGSRPSIKAPIEIETEEDTSEDPDNNWALAPHLWAASKDAASKDDILAVTAGHDPMEMESALQEIPDLAQGYTAGGNMKRTAVRKGMQDLKFAQTAAAGGASPLDLKRGLDNAAQEEEEAQAATAAGASPMDLKRGLDNAAQEEEEAVQALMGPNAFLLGYNRASHGRASLSTRRRSRVGGVASASSTTAARAKAYRAIRQAQRAKSAAPAVPDAPAGSAPATPAPPSTVMSKSAIPPSRSRVSGARNKSIIPTKDTAKSKYQLQADNAGGARISSTFKYKLPKVADTVELEADELAEILAGLNSVRTSSNPDISTIALDDTATKLAAALPVLQAAAKAAPPPAPNAPSGSKPMAPSMPAARKTASAHKATSGLTSSVAYRGKTTRKYSYSIKSMEATGIHELKSSGPYQGLVYTLPATGWYSGAKVAAAQTPGLKVLPGIKHNIPPAHADVAAATGATAIVNAFKPAVSMIPNVIGRCGLPAWYRTPKTDHPMAATMKPGRYEPHYDRPMWEELYKMDKNYLLAGIDKMPANTIALLATNRPFIESFFAGLNQEMAREFLWREYPAIMHGTFFRQFWDYSALNIEGHEDDADADIHDISPMLTWNGPLGDHQPPNMPTAGVILLVKGDLLRRFPNTSIYAIKATKNAAKAEQPPERPWDNAPWPLATGEEIGPVFTQKLPPDVTLLGFPLTPEEAIGSGDDPGYFFVFEEQMGELKFGLEVDLPDSVEEKWSWSHFPSMHPGEYLDAENANVTGTKELDANLWKNGSSADIANAFAQVPVRRYYLASDFVSNL